MGRRDPLCTEPQAGLTAAPGDRRLGSHAETRKQSPDLLSQPLSGTQHPLGVWVSLATLGANSQDLSSPAPLSG